MNNDLFSHFEHEKEQNTHCVQYVFHDHWTEHHRLLLPSTEMEKWAGTMCFPHNWEACLPTGEQESGGKDMGSSEEPTVVGSPLLTIIRPKSDNPSNRFISKELIS